MGRNRGVTTRSPQEGHTDILYPGWGTPHYTDRTSYKYINIIIAAGVLEGPRTHTHA